MNPLFLIRVGATAPFLQVKITQEGLVDLSFNPPAVGCQSQSYGTPVDLTNATVRARMFRCGRPPAPEVALLGTTEVVDAVNGIVQYKWASGDTLTAGSYYMSFEVVFLDNSKLIWPYMLEMFPIEVTP